MLDMTSFGFVLAGLTIIGLLRVLFAFRELRAELFSQRQALNEAACRMEQLSTAAALARAHEHRIADLETRTEVADRAARRASYEEAARLVKSGARLTQLSSTCGLSRGEAQLVSAMWSSESPAVEAELQEVR